MYLHPTSIVPFESADQWQKEKPLGEGVLFTTAVSPSSCSLGSWHWNCPLFLVVRINCSYLFGGKKKKACLWDTETMQEFLLCKVELMLQRCRLCGGRRTVRVTKGEREGQPARPSRARLAGYGTLIPHLDSVSCALTSAHTRAGIHRPFEGSENPLHYFL